MYRAIFQINDIKKRFFFLERKEKRKKAWIHRDIDFFGRVSIPRHYFPREANGNLELLLFLPRSSNIRAIFSRPLKAPSDESGLHYRKLRILANGK